jgi:hypothetical protein
MIQRLTSDAESYSALLKERSQMALPNTGPDGASPSFADEEGQAPDPPETMTH